MSCVNISLWICSLVFLYIYIFNTWFKELWFNNLTSSVIALCLCPHWSRTHQRWSRISECQTTFTTRESSTDIQEMVTHLQLFVTHMLVLIYYGALLVFAYKEVRFYLLRANGSQSEYCWSLCPTELVQNWPACKMDLCIYSNTFYQCTAFWPWSTSTFHLPNFISSSFLLNLSFFLNMVSLIWLGMFQEESSLWYRGGMKNCAFKKIKKNPLLFSVQGSWHIMCF